MKVKRKVLMAILGIVEAILLFLKSQFGLEIDITSLIAGIAATVGYFGAEAAVDFERVKAQAKKFRDLKFWSASVMAVLPAINDALGLNLPIEIIFTLLAALTAALFGKDYKKAKTTGA